MENFTKNKTCTTWCWIIAAVVGAVVALVLWNGAWNFIPSAFIGLIIFIIGGALLSWLLCKPQAQLTSSTVAAAATGVAVASSASSASASAKSTVSTAKIATAKKTPAKKAAAKTTKTAGKAKAAGGDAKTLTAPAVKAAPAKKVAVKATTAKTATAKTTKAKAATTKAATAKTAAAKSTTAKPKVAAEPKAAASAKPVTLTAARAGGADDLKQLKGVGPALEKTLNELGFYHFDQVATWKKKDVAWVDSNLRFKGRIERDGWIAQAKILAKGGTTEFSSKVKKGGVH